MTSGTTTNSIRRMLLAVCTLMFTHSMTFVSPAFMQQGGSYTITKSVTGGGGGATTNGATRVEGTIGQSILGLSSGGAFSLNAGFWQASPCASISISSQPTSQTACSGSSAIFSVSTTGTVGSYQWRKDGINLSDGGNISGATTATLTINPALAADAGSYEVLISGPCTGAPVTSTTASLTINGYSLAPMGQSFPSSGGNGSVNVTTAASCSWIAMSNDPWITITAGANGVGSGTVDYSVANNSGAGRTGTMTIAGQTFTVTQASPTLVTMASLGATAFDEGTLIEWRTGLEVDSLGFNVYRETGGKRQLINSQLIAGSALACSSNLLTGTSYAWWDQSPDRSTSYWVEDVDLSGKSEWHGPVYAKKVGGAPPTRTRSTSLKEIATQIASASSRPVEHAAASAGPTSGFQEALAGRSAVKIGVKHEGWYRLTQSELVSAGLNPDIDPRFLRLFVEGREQPMVVSSAKDGRFDESGSLEFYGTGLDTPSTDTRIYWLIADNSEGLRIEHVKGDGLANPDSSFPFTVERKDRTIYFSALRNGEKENFFGAVVAQTPVDQALTLEHLDPVARGPVKLQVTLQGVTLLPHLVGVQLNGTSVGQLMFNNQSQGFAELEAAQSLLNEGVNVVTLIAQGGPGDVSLVDSIRITYPHRFVADNDALQFTAPGEQQVRVGGFTAPNIRVIDVTDPNTPQEVDGQVEKEGSGFAVTAASPQIATRTLIAFSETQMRHPASIVSNVPSHWRQKENADDLLIIASLDLFASAENLKLARQKQGLKVALVNVEDIYDEFNYGEKDPQALKDFLSYARSNWQLAPRFVLMFGDASYDSRDYLGAGDHNLVPTKLVDTDFMETASDDWFADFDGDGLTEMAIGRLPVRDSKEADVMIAKILDYEAATPADSALLVSDINDGYDFEQATRQLRALLPPSLRVEEIDRGQLDAATAKTRLLAALNRAERVVNYSGHGNVGQWRGDLLNTNDADSLTKAERPLVFVIMTCLNGYFQDPVADGLGESLMKIERGGAVAVWASSGMTLPEEQSIMNQELYRLLFSPRSIGTQPMTLGEAVARAKAYVSNQDIRRTWIFLGDPTMAFR